jgi:predicted DNA-binding transcriptional regulator AlpA
VQVTHARATIEHVTLTSRLVGVELVGLAEVAEMLQLSKARADQLARQRDFPLPVATLTGGRIWDRAAVEAWMRSTGRAK